MENEMETGLVYGVYNDKVLGLLGSRVFRDFCLGCVHVRSSRAVGTS